MPRQQQDPQAASRFADADRYLEGLYVQRTADEAAFRAAEKTLDADQREAVAADHGFRTWRHFGACIAHTRKVATMYVRDSTFKELWRQLKCFEASGELDHLYSPHPFAVPDGLCQAILTWYQQPKFTAAQLRAHRQKILRTCQALRELLLQVTPGGLWDDYASFDLDEPTAERMLRTFQTSPHPRPDGYRYSNQWTANQLVRESGLTPLWAVERILQASTLQPASPLPTKVGSATAFRTYMIRELYMLVVRGTLAPFEPKHSLPDHLIAQVVSLIADRDCAAEDVRKALKELRAEDSSSRNRRKVHRKSA